MENMKTVKCKVYRVPEDVDIFNEHTENIFDRILMQFGETVDDFIFRMINPYCEQCLETKLKKEMVLKALTEYKENHPEEFEE